MMGPQTDTRALAALVRRRLVSGEHAGLGLRARIRRITSEEAVLGTDELTRFVEEIAASLSGLGPLEELIADPSVSEVMVNGPNAVYVERDGQLELTSVTFPDNDAIRALIERVVGPLGLRADESSPLVDARLVDGSRFNAVLPPVSPGGPTCNIRRFVLRCESFAELVARGFCSGEQAESLCDAVRARRTILVSGGTSTGKTTLLNVLSGAIPDGERLITIEDAAELQLLQSHVVSLEARPANIEGAGAVTVRDLVRNALRMRPDRIIVGEVRGAEAADMLAAMTTGHEGSLCTVHANSPDEALLRLETMILTAEASLPADSLRRQIASAIDLVVQIERRAGGERRLAAIHETRGMSAGQIVLADAFRDVSEVAHAGELMAHAS